MSSTVTMNMSLMSTANILPAQQMESLFLLCVKELNLDLRGRRLMEGDLFLGDVTMGQRIVLRFNSDYGSRRARQELRDLFTKRLKVAQENYMDELEDRKRRLRESQAAEQVLLREIAEIEKKQRASEKAMARQEKSECEAMMEELCEAAENKGYDVISEKTEQGMQLQFVRREY